MNDERIVSKAIYNCAVIQLQVSTQSVFPLFLQFGLNDLLCAGGGGLSREVDVDGKVSCLFLDTVKKSPSHH